MPVLDHPVHPSTVTGPGHRYGCWNLPGDLRHTMSNRCRYDLSLSDPACTDCCHRGSGESYDQQIRSNAANG